MKKFIITTLSAVATIACIAAPITTFAKDTKVEPCYVVCPVTGSQHYYQYNESASYESSPKYGEHTYAGGKYRCRTSTITKYTPGSCACGATHTIQYTKTYHQDCGK